MTPVIFRKFKDHEKFNSGCAITAIFPHELGTNDAWTCQDYMRVGQHGSICTKFLTDITIPDKESEYKDLLSELKSIGYDDLKIMQRMPANHLQHRVNQLRELRS